MPRPSRFLTIAALAATGAFLALAALHVTPAPDAQAVFDDRDGDTVTDLAEEITGSDPDDANSTPEDTGAQVVSGFNLCGDGVDNDGDGLIDGEDDGCQDDDSDIFSNAMEELLGSDPDASSSIPEDSRLDAVLEFIGFGTFGGCGDGQDNDEDGLIDGDDPGCTAIQTDDDEFDDATEKRFGSDPQDGASVPEHDIPNPGSCEDGIDNDLDGLTDDDDPACAVPANDDRADATVIDAIPYSDGPTVMKNATVEGNEPRPTCSFGSIAGTVWYRFTPDQDMTLIADMNGSDFNTTLAVWREDNGRLRELACGRGFFSGLPSGESAARVVIDVAAGETYFFQLDGFPFENPLPQMAFNVEQGFPPPNDDFNDATDVAPLPFTDSIDVSATTLEEGEPSPPCGFLGDGSSSVWYRFTPDEDTLVVADTAGSDFFATIGVWVQGTFGLRTVDCAVSGAIFVPTPLPDGEVSPARVAFEAEAGQTYFLQVGKSQSVGPPPPGGFSLTFNVDIGVAPANDDFADARPIDALPFSETVDTLTATNEPGEPTPGCLTYERIESTVWYRFTPDEDALVRMYTEDVTFSNVIGVYQGDKVDDLTTVACALPSYPETQLAFRAQAGETYYIQTGGISFFVCCEAGEGDEDAEPAIAAQAPGASGIFSSGSVTFEAEAIEDPPCPDPTLTVTDPAGDTPSFIQGPAPDIVAVEGGSDGETYCLRLLFNEPIEPADAGADRSVFATVDFDTDSNEGTGVPSSLRFRCPSDPHLGVEAELNLSRGSGLLTPIFLFEPRPEPPPIAGEPVDETPYAIARYGPRSVEFAIPLDAIGGDDRFRFAVLVQTVNFGTSDCAPNGGFIPSPEPAPMGDVNCDGRTNAADATLILQLFAGIARSLPCQYVGDVNHNGGIGPLDALLILQFGAGLIDALPGPANSALEAAIQATAEALDVPAGRVQLIDKEARDWPDSCLGLPEPEEVCQQVITPGFRITLEVRGESSAGAQPLPTSEPFTLVVWRTNESGSEVRLEAIAVP